jgi:hypothetical protein
MIHVREIEPPLTEDEVAEPLALDDLLAAAFGPALLSYGYRPALGMIAPGSPDMRGNTE